MRIARGRVSLKAKGAKRAVTLKPGRTYVAKARLFGAKKKRR